MYAPLTPGRIIALAPATPAADDWPAFRGPEGDARSTFRGRLVPWPEAGPRELWRAPLQGGYSGIAVADGRVVTMTAGGAEEVVAFDTGGREVWRTGIDSVYRNGQGDGPRSTPTLDGTVMSSSPPPSSLTKPCLSNTA